MLQLPLGIAVVFFLLARTGQTGSLNRCGERVGLGPLEMDHDCRHPNKTSEYSQYASSHQNTLDALPNAQRYRRGYPPAEHRALQL